MTSPTDRSAPTGRDYRGPDWWMMVRKFLEKGKSVASFAPSSRFLVRAMLQGIDFQQTRTLVELGAGLGPITAELIKRAVGTPCKLLIVESDPDFCRKLRERFANGPAEIVQGDATELDRMLDERGLDRVDQIVSGLPVPSFSKPMQEKLFAAVRRRLAPTGEFRQLTVMPWVYQRLYRSYFDEVRFRLVLRNLPPGGVYLCREIKQWDADFVRGSEDADLRGSNHRDC